MTENFPQYLPLRQPEAHQRSFLADNNSGSSEVPLILEQSNTTDARNPIWKLPRELDTQPPNTHIKVKNFIVAK